MVLIRFRQAGHPGTTIAAGWSGGTDSQGTR
jgi:hypothetical protein